MTDCLISKFPPLCANIRRALSRTNPHIKAPAINFIACFFIILILLKNRALEYENLNRNIRKSAVYGFQISAQNICRKNSYISDHQIVSVNWRHKKEAIIDL